MIFYVPFIDTLDRFSKDPFDISTVIELLGLMAYPVQTSDLLFT